MNIEAESLCAVLSHREGIFKGTPIAAKQIAFLNQADIPGVDKAAHNIMANLAANKRIDLSRVIIGSTRHDPVVHKYQDLNT